MHDVRVGLIGYGYWGPNLARNLASTEGARLTVICDASASRLAQAAAAHPTARCIADFAELLDDQTIDAVVLATPAASHAALGLRALEAGKHLLVEKPLALTTAECRSLIEAADQRGLVLMVGHTFLYNAAVQWLRSFIERGEAGDIFYLYAQRLNLGQVRSDVNVLWNLAPHDVSIMLSLLGEEPVSVSAHGQSYLGTALEDVAFVTMEFPGGALGHLHLSWLDPNKVRRLTLVGSRKMVVYDDVKVDWRIQVFDKGVDLVTRGSGVSTPEYADFQMQLRTGDLVIPRIDFHEPLRLECTEFTESIRDGRKPLSDGHDGLRVVRVLEAAQRSIEAGGERIVLLPSDAEPSERVALIGPA